VLLDELVSFIWIITLVTLCLKEQNLDNAATIHRRDLTHVPEIADYLKYM
jgi:hypothetical protein